MIGKGRESTTQRRGRGVGVEVQGGMGEIMIRVIEGVVMIGHTTIGTDTEIGIDMMGAAIEGPAGTMIDIEGTSYCASSSFQSGILLNGDADMYDISRKGYGSSITPIHQFTGCEILSQSLLVIFHPQSHPNYTTFVSYKATQSQDEQSDE